MLLPSNSNRSQLPCYELQRDSSTNILIVLKCCYFAAKAEASNIHRRYVTSRLGPSSPEMQAFAKDHRRIFDLLLQVTQNGPTRSKMMLKSSYRQRRRAKHRHSTFSVLSRLRQQLRCLVRVQLLPAQRDATLTHTRSCQVCACCFFALSIIGSGRVF